MTDGDLSECKARAYGYGLDDLGYDDIDPYHHKNFVDLCNHMMIMLHSPDFMSQSAMPLISTCNKTLAATCP